MKVTDVQNRVIELTQQYFISKGYSLRRTDVEYRLKKQEVTNIFRINIVAKADWFIILPEVYFSNKAINLIHRNIVNKEIKLTGITSGFGVHNNHTDRGYYPVETTQELENCINNIKLDFEEIALPFYNSINNIVDIDKYFNQSEVVIGSHYSSCDAIIASYLANGNYKKLAQRYYSFWQVSQGRLADVILRTEAYLSELNT